MKAFSLATLFLPLWALPWIAVIGVIAWIAGARALALGAALLLAVELMLVPLLAPWLASLPGWALILISGVMGLLILHTVIDLAFGKETAGHVSGTFLVRLLDFLVAAPFRLLAWLLRAITQRRP